MYAANIVCEVLFCFTSASASSSVVFVVAADDDDDAALITFSFTSCRFASCWCCLSISSFTLTNFTSPSSNVAKISSHCTPSGAPSFKLITSASVLSLVKVLQTSAILFIVFASYAVTPTSNVATMTTSNPPFIFNKTQSNIRVVVLDSITCLFSSHCILLAFQMHTLPSLDIDVTKRKELRNINTTSAPSCPRSKCVGWIFSCISTLFTFCLDSGEEICDDCHRTIDPSSLPVHMEE